MDSFIRSLTPVVFPRYQDTTLIDVKINPIIIPSESGIYSDTVGDHAETPQVRQAQWEVNRTLKRQFYVSSFDPWIFRINSGVFK